MAKSVNLIVRLSPEEREALRAAAARDGYPGDRLSEWVRRVLFRKAGLPAVRARRPEGRPPAQPGEPGPDSSPPPA